MIKIYIPKNFTKINEYASKIIFEEIFGLSYKIFTHSKDQIEIHYDSSDKTITLSSEFSNKAKDLWLSPNHLPEEIKYFNLKNSIFDLSEFISDKIPVLYGNNILEMNNNNISLDIDIFGTTFFMLSRYEECFENDLDSHKRFKAKNTIAYKNNFLDRPIVNEYSEILWRLMKYLWPNIVRKKRKFRAIVSCDVDHPFDDALNSFYRIIRRFFSRIIRDKNIKLALFDIKYFLSKKIFNNNGDSYTKNIYWMMSLADSKNLKIQFNFIPKQTDMRFDSKYSLDHPDVKKIFKDIIDSNHNVGIHPGYNTSSNIKDFNKSVDIFKNELGGNIIFGGRQHYLRFKMHETPELWNNNKIHHDSSMGYSNTVGFRSGICHEYSMFSFSKMSIIKTKQIPLIVMESAIFNDNIFNDKKIMEIQSLIDICKKYNGDFTLLWHNSYFSHVDSKKYYENILDRLK